MITIYGVYRSRATRPLWLLAEAGAEFRHVPVIQAYRLGSAGQQDAPLNTASAEFRAINPLGQIPVMEDDGLVLTESLAICLHLARRVGGAIGPANDAELAQMEQWALFAATSVETPAVEILFAAAAEPRTPEQEATMAVCAEKLRRPLARLDGALDCKEFLVAGRFTVADIVVAECVRYAQAHPTLMAEFPQVSRWLAACQARPGFQAMWQKRLAEPA